MRERLVDCGLFVFLREDGRRLEFGLMVLRKREIEMIDCYDVRLRVSLSFFLLILRRRFSFSLLLRMRWGRSFSLRLGLLLEVEYL